MNAPHKIVPKSKISEWRGLDRISLIVHGMRCIWREQEKDDIGIDGEIELCRPREDGDGLIGTGKIVKVQSKSGASYIARDDAEIFAAPVSDRDLRYWRDLNVPMIFIVFHPEDDCLYWKDIKAYLKDHPDAFKPPLRILFNKAADRFDESAYAALCEICEQAPERIAFDQGETLFTNLLPVLTLPKRIWVAPVLPEKQRNFHDRLTGAGFVPPYVYQAGMLITLSDPTSPTTALANVVDPGAVEDFDLTDWLSQSAENEDHLRTLLNRLLHKHLHRIGCTFQRSPRRYFINKGLDEETPLHRKWFNVFSQRAPTRLVAKFYTYGKHRFYKHLALNARFERFGNQWAVGIYPGLHYSTNGTAQWEGKAAASFAIRARAQEFNNAYYGNVLFWASQMSGSKSSFDLCLDDQVIVTISGVPLTADADFSVRIISAAKA